MTSFDSSLLTPSPHMRARINVLDISDVSVEASLAMVKLDARLLMIDLSVFLRAWKMSMPTTSGNYLKIC